MADLPLSEILQMGGPTGTALLFAWLWWREAGAHEKTREKLEALQTKLIEASGVFDRD
jgi:hypothetical protein